MFFVRGVGDLDDFLDPLGDVLVVDDDAVDVGGEDVADGAGDEVAFGVKLDRRRLARALLLDRSPTGA